MEMLLRAYTDKENGKRYIKGLAAVFNSQSKTINEHGRTFREIVLPGAFDEVLSNDKTKVKATVDHDPKMLLGRTESGTLSLEVVSRGLYYVVEVPDTQTGNDTYEQVSRGDYFESSFLFGIKRSDFYWGRDKGDGMLLRYIKNITLLKDVSVVTDGAYAATNTTAETSRNYKLDYLDKLPKEQGDSEMSVCQRFNSDICSGTSIEEDVVERSESPTEKKEEEVVEVKEVPEKTEEKPVVEEVVVEKEEKPKPKETEKPTEDERSWKDFVKDKRSELKKQIIDKS